MLKTLSAKCWNQLVHIALRLTQQKNADQSGAQSWKKPTYQGTELEKAN